MRKYFVRFLKTGEIVAEMCLDSNEENIEDDADLVLAMNNPEIEYDDMDIAEVESGEHWIWAK